MGKGAGEQESEEQTHPMDTDVARFVLPLTLQALGKSFHFS
jgi:hypothetical protein